jgi:ketosteroid isomerase-like protein
VSSEPTLEQALDSYRKLLEEELDAYNRRDIEAFVAGWHPDCEWHPFLTARVEGDPGYHGHNGLRTWFEDIDEMFAGVRAELDDIREVGGLLVGLGHMEARGRGSGAEVSTEVGWVFEMRGDKCLRGWAYTNHAEALQAAEARR